jgi:hypothetical protein
MPQQRAKLVLTVENSPQQRIVIRLDKDEATKGHGALSAVKGGRIVDVSLEDDEQPR